MNKSTINSIVFFIILVLLQALVLNNVNFMGYINPYLYIMFILLFPVRSNRTAIIFLGFLLGLSVDLFLDSGGIHAAATVAAAYARPLFLKSSFGMIYEHQSIKFGSTEFSKRLMYFSLFTLVHHFVLFSLEIFNISLIILILKKTLFSSIFTILLILLVTALFQRKSK